eukprot:gene10056-biopygen6485
MHQIGHPRPGAYTRGGGQVWTHLPGKVRMGEKGKQFNVVTADNVARPTQYCIPVGMKSRLLITHILSVDPEPLGSRPPTGLHSLHYGGCISSSSSHPPAYTTA